MADLLDDNDMLAGETPVEAAPPEKPPAATAISRRLAPGGGGGGAWLGDPKTASSEKFGHTGEKKFHLLGTDLFGDEIKADATGKLREKFDFPPFSVLNAREGPWQERKRAWLACGIQSEVGRGENLLKMSDTLLEPDPEKRAAMQAARTGDARTFGSGDPGDLGANFKRKETASLAGLTVGVTADAYRKAGEEVEGAGGSGTSIFDPVLAELCYRWFCPAGGQIVDPFAGGSVRGIVAGLLGFSYHGIDLRPEQIAANEAQRAQICPDADINWVVGDSNLELPNAPEADFIFSCPPYGDLEQYSDDPKDLSAMTWEGFVGIYRSIIRKSVERLKPNRFACFVIGEYRDKKTGLYRGFVPLTCGAFMAAGAALYNEAILITAVGSLPIRITKQFEASRKLGKTHQNVIICCKGDPALAAEAIRAARGAPPAARGPRPTRPATPPPAPNLAEKQAVTAPESAGPSALAFVAAQPARVEVPRVEVPRVDVPRVEVVTPAPAGTLASFLGSQPVRATDNWRPETPRPLDGIDSIVLNVETNGLNWAGGDRPIGVTWGTLDGQVRQFLPFGFRDGNLDETTVLEWARRELRGKHITNANTRFDIHMSREWGVDLEGQGNTVSDVMHYAALLDDHRKRFAVDVLAQDYLGGVSIPRVDERNMASYGAGEVAARAEYQAEVVAALRNKMWPLLDEQELQGVRQLEDEVIYPVVEMEKNGARIDLELLEQYHAECGAEHGRLMQEIAAEVGFAFEHTASGWRRLFERCGLTPRDSYAEDVIEEYDHPLVVKAHYAGQVGSLNSKTFAAYKSQIGPDGILRYDINQLRGDDGGTVSGRFSIGYVQQVPNHDNHSAVFGDRWFPRRLFIPASGLYLDADAAQIEYRIFAHFASNPKVLAAYAADPTMSFHKFTWEMIKVYRPDMKYTWQKSMNFMKMYGGGLSKLALMMGFITKAQYAEIQADPNNARRWNDPLLQPATEIQRAYEQMMPEVAPLQARASHLAKSACDKDCSRGGKHASFIRQLHRDYPHRGYVKTIKGRRSRFPNNWKTYRGLNRVIQGSAADVMKQKLVELHRLRKETGFLMRLTVHDAVGGDVPDAAAAERVREILNRQSFPQLQVPILWSLATGANWAECK